MEKKITYVLALLLLVSSGYSKTNNTLREIVVSFKKDVYHAYTEKRKTFGLSNMDAVSRQYELVDVRPITRGNLVRTYILKFHSSVNVDEVIQAYWHTGMFEYVEHNNVGVSGGYEAKGAVNDTYYGRQWGLLNDGTFSIGSENIHVKKDADIDIELVWNITRGNRDVIVAVLDGGVQLGHPEFSGRIWKNNQEIPGDGIDNDNNGYIDDVNGWDFAADDSDPSDEQGHGTNVAGIIGANGTNGQGYAGVDWKCRIMPVRVLNDNGVGKYTDMVDGIYYAVDNGARVLNLSLGGSSFSSMLEEALKYAHDKGVVVVASMMNHNKETTYYPAGYETVIAVGATDPDDTRSAPFFWGPTSGSNYGAHIDVVAPGNYMYGLTYSSDVKYDSYWGGTSQAAPVVAGLASLLVGQYPALTPKEVRDIITASAEDGVGDPVEDTPGWDPYYGHGRVNAYKAFQELKKMYPDAVPVQRFASDNHSGEQGWEVILSDDETNRKEDTYDIRGRRILFEDNQLKVTPMLQKKSKKKSE